MPGIEDYFLTDDPTKPKPKKASGTASSKGGGIENYFEDKPSTASTMTMGTGTSVNLDAYTPYMKGGVNSDFNIDKERAQNQGTLEQVGKTIGNTALNVVTGMGEMVGFMGSLATEWKDGDKDYSNWLTKSMEDMHNPFGEVYRENPDKVWDMKDPAWWYNNVGQLVESAAAFALPGGEIAKGFEMAAEAAAGGMKLGKTGLGVAKGLGQVASAALMGWQEGAMSGYRVYDQAYKTQLQKNIDAGDDYAVADQKAKKVASDAASTTVQMYTGLGAILNLTAFTPLFKRADDEAYAWLSGEGRRLKGESMEGWKGRLSAAGFDNKDIAKIFAPRHGLSSMASEVFQEGSEEYIQNYFDKTGEDIGNDKGRVRKGMDAVQDFIDKTADSEGLLNFALGGLGGGLQTVILDNVPLHRVQKYDAAGNAIFKTNGTNPVPGKNGEPQFETQLVSSRTREYDKSKKYFESVKDAIIKDIDWFQTKNDEMMKTTDPVLKESLRTQMFNVNNLNAVTSGLSDNWKQQYQEVHDIDNTKSLGDALQPELDNVTAQLGEAIKFGTEEQIGELTKKRNELFSQRLALADVTEAMQKGYAKDKHDNWYKEQAQGAIQDLTEMQKMWTDTQKRYGATDEQKTAGLADYIFAHQVDLYNDQKILRSAEADHAKLTAEYEVRHAGLTDEFDMLARQYATDWDVVEKQRTELTDDLKNSEDPKVQEKYHAVPDLKRELTRRINELNDRGHELNDGLKLSFDSSDWTKANPGKTYEDYFKALRDKYTDRETINEYGAQIENHRTRTSMLNSKLNDILTTKGIINTIKKAQLQKRNLIKEMEERNKRDNDEAKLAQRSDEAAKTLQKTQLSIQERKVRTEMAAVEKRITENTKKLADYENQQREIKKKTSLWAQLNKNVELDDLKSKIKITKYDIAGDKIRLSKMKEHLDAIEATLAEATASDTVVSTAPVTPVPDSLSDDSSEGTSIVPTEVGEPVTIPVPDTSVPAISEYMDDEDVTDEESNYAEALSRLSKEQRQQMQNYETKLRRGEPFSYEAILSKIGKTPEAMVAAQALKEYMKVIAEDEMPTEMDAQPGEPGTEEVTTEVTAEEPVAEEITAVDPVPEGPKDSPVTEAPAERVTRVIHKGKKATSGTTIVNATLDSIDYRDVKGNHRIVSPEGKLNPNTPESVLKPKELKPGTTVTLRVHEYSGPVRENAPNSFKNQEFKDFLDSKGMVLQTDEAIGNVPIGVFDENDDLIGYLRSQTGLTMSYEGADDYRNLADSETVPASAEIEKNMRIRRQVVNSSGATIKIASTGPGSVIENQKKISEHEWQRVRLPAGSASKPGTGAVPGPVVMAIINGGQVFEEKKGATTRDMATSKDDLRDMEKAPVMLLPMANGKYVASPLYMNSLADNKIALDSIMRVIELFMDQSPEAIEERQKLTDLTGFDVNSAAGMRSYINQFWTYTEKFDFKDTMTDPALLSGAKQSFMFNITNNGEITIGTRASGRKAMSARPNNLVQFREALKAGLSTRYKNFIYTDSEVGTQGINSDEPFKEVYYTGTGWKTIAHKNYNEYIKTHATTFVNGRNQLKDGTYVYSANPQIDLDETTLVASRPYTAKTLIEVPAPTNAARKSLGLDKVMKIMAPDQSGGFRLTFQGKNYLNLAQFYKGRWEIYPQQTTGEFNSNDPATGQTIFITSEQAKKAIGQYVPKELMDLLEEADGLKGLDAQDKFMKGDIQKYLKLYRKEQLEEQLIVERDNLRVYESPTYPNKGSQASIVATQKATIAKLETAYNSLSGTGLTVSELKAKRDEEMAAIEKRVFSTEITSDEAFPLKAEVFRKYDAQIEAARDAETLAEEVPVPKDIEAGNDFDDMLEGMGMGFMPSTIINTSIEQSPQMEIISLDLLQRLHNFTPSGERNGLTPEQVLKDMIDMGIPYIAEGHNPFMKCN